MIVLCVAQAQTHRTSVVNRNQDLTNRRLQTGAGGTSNFGGGKMQYILNSPTTSVMRIWCVSNSAWAPLVSHGGGGAVVGGVGRNLSLGHLAPLVRRGFANAKPLSFHATHYTHAVRSVTPSTPPLSLSRRSFGVLKILSAGTSLRCLGGGAQNCTRCVAHSRSPCVVRSPACVRARFSRAFGARTLAVTPSTPPLSLSRRSFGVLQNSIHW